MRRQDILNPGRVSGIPGGGPEASPSARAILFFGLLFMLCSVLISPAAAHVPLTSGDNAHIDDAFPVTDPTKSWVVYGELDGGGAVRYYRMEMQAGDELRLSLFTPDGSASFVPGLVVTGPGLVSSGTLPPSVEIPHPDDDTGHDTGGEETDYGTVVIGGAIPAGAEFEPFTPSALYPAAAYSHRMTAPGTWYVAVYAPETAASGGNFGLAIGYREEFSLAEWLYVPFSVMGIHRWEGQSWPMILGPLVVTVIVGFALIFRPGQRERKAGPIIDGPFGWLSVTAGLFFIGTGMMLLVQTLWALAKAGPTAAAVLPLFFIAVAVLPGGYALRTGLQSSGWGTKTGGLLMIAVGIGGLFLWAGLLVGPVCAMLAGTGALVRGKKGKINCDATTEGKKPENR